MNFGPSPLPPRRLLEIVAVVAATGLIVLGPRWLPAAPVQEDGIDTSEFVTVRTALARERDAGSAATLVATGTLEARRQVQLSFAVDGVVERWLADDGDAVEEGTVLARLDPIPFEAEVSRARAQVEYLEKSLARSGRLLDQQALSAEEYDAQRAELTAARAQLRLARWRLERSALRSPFDGRVERRRTEVGQVVAPRAPAFDLIVVEELQMDAALAATDLSRVDLEAPVEIRVRGQAGLRASARVDHAPVRSDARSGSVPLRLVVDNAAGELLAGMVAEASFEEAIPSSTSTTEVRVPVTALRLDDQGQSVWRVEDGRALRVPVHVGPVRGDEIVITEGLRSGDEVVLHPPDRLRDGNRVRVSREGSR